MPVDSHNKEINMDAFASDVSSIYIDPNNFSMNVMQHLGMNEIGVSPTDDLTPTRPPTHKRLGSKKWQKKVKLISDFVKELEQTES